MLKIGDFARMAGVSVDTLRYYDKTGLLKPTGASSGGYRLYVPDQLSRLRWIRVLQEAGCSLEDIREYFRMERTGEEVLAMLEEKHRDVEGEIRRAKERSSLIRQLQEEIQADLTAEASITVREIPDLPSVGLIQARIGACAEQNALWDELDRMVEEQGLVPSGNCFSLYLEPRYGQVPFTVEVVQPLEGMGQAQDRVVFMPLPGIREAACLLHTGPYERMVFAYQALRRWLEAKGYEAGCPSREMYVRGAWNGTEPKDWQTEIQIPLVRKG